MVVLDPTWGGLDIRFRRGHVALAVEEASGINNKARRVDIADHDAVFFNLQAFGGVDGSLYFPVMLMIRVWISPSTSP